MGADGKVPGCLTAAGVPAGKAPPFLWMLTVDSASTLQTMDVGWRVSWLEKAPSWAISTLSP